MHTDPLLNVIEKILDKYEHLTFSEMIIGYCHFIIVIILFCYDSHNIEFSCDDVCMTLTFKTHIILLNVIYTINPILYGLFWITHMGRADSARPPVTQAF